MGKQKAPAPPNPKDTSAAQTGTSVATSIANANLQNVNQIGADGVEALARSPAAGTLTTLDLAYNRIGDAGAAALASQLSVRGPTHPLARAAPRRRLAGPAKRLLPERTSTS